MDDTILNLELQHIKDTVEFYSPYFTTVVARDEFINQVFEFDWDERRPRRMIFQVQRFVTLATEIDKIRPARDGLRVLFLKCCLESLTKLAGYKNAKEFFLAFEHCFSDQGKTYILNNFKLSYFEYPECGVQYEADHDLTLAEFFNVVKATRDMVVHEGNYWEMQFFAYDEEYTWLTCIETDQKLLTSYQGAIPQQKKITYHFETTLQYDKFIFYFVEACVRLIESYMESKCLSPDQSDLH